MQTKSEGASQEKEAPLSENARLPAQVKVLGAVSLLNDIASEMVYPLLPQVLSRAGAGVWGLGLIEGLAESASSLLKLGSAYWAERLGRKKPFLLFGYGLAALARPLLALASAPWQVLAIRLVDRVGKGVRAAPRDALIAETTPPELRGRAFGLHRALDHLGAVLGPALAALLLWLWPGRESWVIGLSLVPGLGLLLLVVLGVRETQRAAGAEGVAPGQNAMPAPKLSISALGRPFRGYLLALGLFTLANSSDLFLFQRAYDVGLTSRGGLILWAGFHVFKSVGSWLAGGAVDRWGGRPLIVAGWLVYAAVYLGFGLSTAAWQTALLFVGYAVFYALTEPAERALVASLAPADQRSLAFGWFHLVVGLGALPSSLIFGGLYHEFGGPTAFTASALFALAAAVALWLAPQAPRGMPGEK